MQREFKQGDLLYDPEKGMVYSCVRPLDGGRNLLRECTTGNFDIIVFNEDKRRITKTQAIVYHLKAYGTISSWEAIEYYRVTRLASVIGKLKERMPFGTGIRSDIYWEGKRNWAVYTWFDPEGELRDWDGTVKKSKEQHKKYPLTPGESYRGEK